MDSDGEFLASSATHLIDDILREQIGKTCSFYVDDVIIFSENENSHVKPWIGV